MKYIEDNSLQKIIDFDHYDPFDVLGYHEIISGGEKASSIRAFIPSAKTVSVINLQTGQENPMELIHPDGFYIYIDKSSAAFFPYELKITYNNEYTQTTRDPYSFLPVISDFDRHLFNEGSHQEMFEKLGAHIMKIDGVAGVHFAVWAPNARSASVTGDFNGWDTRRCQMRVLGHSGIWEIFIPGISEGDIYKFAIKTHEGTVLFKADPYSYYSENRPKTGSIVWDINKFEWNDIEWIKKGNKNVISINLLRFTKFISVHGCAFLKRATVS